MLGVPQHRQCWDTLFSEARCSVGLNLGAAGLARFLGNR